MWTWTNWISIDRSTHAALSESEGQKLKTALHALAEGLERKRSTEKTKVVLPQNVPPVDKPNPGESARQGHGRNGAAAFSGAHWVAVAHATLHSGDRCPACRQGRVYRQKEPATGTVRGACTAGSHRVRDGATTPLNGANPFDYFTELRALREKLVES